MRQFAFATFVAVTALSILSQVAHSSESTSYSTVEALEQRIESVEASLRNQERIVRMWEESADKLWARWELELAKYERADGGSAAEARAERRMEELERGVERSNDRAYQARFGVANLRRLLEDLQERHAEALRAR